MNTRLKSLAYRMLGSVADAEDVVQEAQLRLHQADPPPRSSEAFLYRVVSNLCVDQLRREKVRRKHYVGPWLPEPLLHLEGHAEGHEEVDASAELVEVAEQLSMGFMLMLERLSPAERVVYVLREGFDFSFAEIAELLGVSAAAARQRGRRARLRLRQTPAVGVASADEQKTLLTALLERVAERDVDGLIALMSEDAVVFADGGGVVSAAMRPIRGRQRIAQVTLHLAQKAQAEGLITFDFAAMNGGWGLVLRQNGALHSCFQVGVRRGLIEQIYVVRNPAKLARL